MQNKDADHFRGNREAEQRLCFRFKDSTILLLPKSEISRLEPSSMAVQPGLCRTWSEIPKTGFSQNKAHIIHMHAACVLYEPHCQKLVLGVP